MVYKQHLILATSCSKVCFVSADRWENVSFPSWFHPLLFWKVQTWPSAKNKLNRYVVPSVRLENISFEKQWEWTANISNSCPNVVCASFSGLCAPQSDLKVPFSYLDPRDVTCLPVMLTAFLSRAWGYLRWLLGNIPSSGICPCKYIL